MKNFFFPVFLFFFLSQSILAQSYQTIRQVQPLLNEQTFYLNSKTRLGGKPRNAIKIELPENAVQWYYIFTTSKKENSSGDNLKLFQQLTALVGKGLLNSNLIGIGTNVAYQVIKPSGAGVVDVYLTDAKGREQFFAESWNMYSFEKPEKLLDGTRENLKDGIITVNDLSQNPVYLCFANPSVSEGIYVSIEAAALVEVQQFVDEWTAASKDQFYNDCAMTLRHQPEAIQDACSCYQSKITSRYKPQEYNGFSQSEKELQQQALIEACLALMGHESLSRKNKIKALEEEIRGLEVVKDYAKLASRYEELLQLGEDSPEVFYHLSRYLLLIKAFDQSKAHLTDGLGKYPKENALWLNLAHCQLLMGNSDEALPIYLQYKGEKTIGKQKWEVAVTEDFQVFRKAGITNDHFEKVEALLKNANKN